MMSLSLDEPRPIDSRGRASPPGEASSGELSGELCLFSRTFQALKIWKNYSRTFKDLQEPWFRVSTNLTEQISRFPGHSRRDFKKNPGHVCIALACYVMYKIYKYRTTTCLKPKLAILQEVILCSSHTFSIFNPSARQESRNVQNSFKLTAVVYIESKVSV